MRTHLAGDVTIVSVMPRIGVGDAKIKANEKKAKIPVCLVLSLVPFKSGV